MELISQRYEQLRSFFLLGLVWDHFIWSNCNDSVISKMICIQQMSLTKVSPWLDSHLTKSVVVNLHVACKQYHMHLFPINRQQMVNIRLKVTQKKECGLERSWNLGTFDKACCSVGAGQQWGHLEKYALTIVSDSFISELVTNFLEVRFQQRYYLSYPLGSIHSRTTDPPRIVSEGLAKVNILVQHFKPGMGLSQNSPNWFKLVLRSQF